MDEALICCGVKVVRGVVGVKKHLLIADVEGALFRCRECGRTAGERGSIERVLHVQPAVAVRQLQLTPAQILKCALMC